MELVYKNDKVKKQCTSVKEAKKLFGGNTLLATNLLFRINALKSAIAMKAYNNDANLSFSCFE